MTAYKLWDEPRKLHLRCLKQYRWTRCDTIRADTLPELFTAALEAGWVQDDMDQGLICPACQAAPAPDIPGMLAENTRLKIELEELRVRYTRLAHSRTGV